MLSAHERTPREIQGRFPVEDQRFAQSVHVRSPSDRCRRAYTTAVLATTAQFVLMLVGPNVLTEREIIARMTSVPQRRSAVLGTHEVRWPVSSPEALPGNGFAASPAPRRSIPSAAA